MLTEDAVIKSLNDCIPPDSGWHLEAAISVNDSGEIVGRGRQNGRTRAFLLVPIPAIINVAVDIKPGSCPNTLNTKSQGVLPVAIVGTGDFNISTIDPASVRLAGVAPLRSSEEDVATPLVDKIDECECTTDGPDGYLDLTLKFDTQEIFAALGDVEDSDLLSLTLTGQPERGIWRNRYRRL